MFHAGVPDKLIRDVTGHRSNALHLYERPTLQQKHEVSKILVQSFDGKENRPTSQPMRSSLCNSGASAGSLPSTSRSSGAILGSLFSGLGNCNITISPQTFTVNVGSASRDTSIASQCVAETDRDIHSLMQGFDLEEFLCTTHGSHILLHGFLPDWTTVIPRHVRLEFLSGPQIKIVDILCIIRKLGEV